MAETGAANRRPEAVPWSALDILAIVGLVIGGNIGVFVILGALWALGMELLPEAYGDFFSNSLLETSALLILQWVITLGAALAFLLVQGYRLSAKILGFRKTPLGKAILWFIIIMALFYVVAQPLYYWIVEQINPDLLPEQDISEDYGTSVASFIIAFSQVALVVPFLEELFFRGIIHQGLEQRFGFIPGALISSAIFAISHIDPAVYAPIFLLGFGFAYLLHRTRSLWPPVAGHFLVNAIAVTAQFLT